MVRVVAFLVTVAACGRVGFDDRTRLDPDALDAPGDARPDLPGGTLTQSLVVGGAADEGEIDQGLYFPDGEDVGMMDTLYIGWYPNGWTWSYFRFAVTTTIPPSATIVDARLRLWGRGTIDLPAGNALLAFGELAADPAPVTMFTEKPSEPTGRPVTQASARWPETGGVTWMLDAWNESSNLAHVLNELAGSTGLVAGTHVQLWVRGETAVEGEVGSESFNLPGGHHGTLDIAWIEP